MRTRVHGLSRGSLSLALLVLFLLVPAAANTAKAQNEYGKGDPAVYLGVSGLAAFDDRGDLWFWNWGSADVEPGANVRAGIRLGAPLAFEIQGDYVTLDDWEDNDNWTMTVNFRIYPTLIDYEESFGIEGFSLEDVFPEALQPYLVAGAGVMGGTGDNGDGYQLTGAFRLGAGADFYVTPTVAISFGYEWITGVSYWDHRDTRNLVLGVQYTF
jgi:hypothetical protein